jgi:hypothetical protein
MSAPEFRSAIAHEERRPCGLVISSVWKVPNTQTGKGYLIQYELNESDGTLVGIFHTPATSRLAQHLLKYLQRNKRR